MIKDSEIFLAALSQSPEGMVIFNENNELIYCNEAFCDSLAYHKLELLHHPLFEIIPASFLEKLELILEGQKNNPNGDAFYEKPIKNKSGEIVWFNVVSKLFKLKEKEYIVCFYRNEVDFRVQKEQLQESNKRLSEYSFLTSHKLRHPIANILGLINLFDTNNLSNPENGPLIDYLKQASFQLNEVVHELNHTLNSAKYKEEINLFAKTGYPKSVMLIDDDSINHFITKSIISRVDPNMIILSYDNPKQALQYLNAGNNLPEIILIDLGLRWMTEWDFMKEYSGIKGLKIPCYIFRNFIEPIDKSNGKRYANFKEFVVKPITTDKLEMVFNN